MLIKPMKVGMGVESERSSIAAGVLAGAFAGALSALDEQAEVRLGLGGVCTL